MFWKAVRRAILPALILTAVYFLSIRHGGENRRGREAAPPSRTERDLGRERRSPREGRQNNERDQTGARCESTYFAQWREPETGACRLRTSHGFPIPDARCTPGGANPSVTTDVLREPGWRTRSIRNCETSEAQKHVAYGWYRVIKPRVNSNENQVCELDHLVPLELGGADGMGNIWPQCGPADAALRDRYFKRKDHVENYLAEQVKSGHMALSEAQRGIARDWTSYLNDAERWCAQRGRC